MSLETVLVKDAVIPAGRYLWEALRTIVAEKIVETGLHVAKDKWQEHHPHADGEAATHSHPFGNLRHRQELVSLGL